MSTIQEIKEIPEKLHKHADNMTLLFKRHNVNSVSKLVEAYKNDSSFKSEWKELWLDVSKEDGGKLSLTTIGVVIGAGLGGVGVAAAGSAVGVPLAIVLGLGGFLSGSLIDSLKVFTSQKRVSITLPQDIYDAIQSDAKSSGLTAKSIIEHVVDAYQKRI